MSRWGPELRGTCIKTVTVHHKGDKRASKGIVHLRPKPEIVKIWGLNAPDRPPNPIRKGEGEALHLFGGVRNPIRPL